jgi:hypothetical protein
MNAPGHILVLLTFVTSMRIVAADQATDFDRTIAPLFVQRCLSCHEGPDAKGKLDLSHRDFAMAGGESGRVIEPGDLENSLLWQHVESDTMPPKKPLTNEEKATLKAWITGGAKWGTEKIDPFRFTTDSRAGVDWWSLKPLQSHTPPQVERAGWSTNPVDAFVLERLQQSGLSPSPIADKRTLIRRLSFDLLGLPPTPDEVNTFLADNSDDAWEKLVDRILASPHYGERWARHWLDVARFGESNGFEYDEPRDNFWHYRNWVINALNQDMPYDQFVRLQLAGDVLHPDDFNAVSASGFLVAGPHNTTLPSNDKMRMSMAQDELEDLVGSVGQTFLGLTANCARCHDHKFDPISQQNYYQFAATLNGVTHGERTIRVPLSAEQQQRIKWIDQRTKVLLDELEAIQQPIREAIVAERKASGYKGPEPPKSLARWEFNEDLNDSEGAIKATLNGGARLENGTLVVDGKDGFVASAPIATDIAEKTLEAWVQLDNLEQGGGAAISLQTLDGATFDAIVFGEREAKKWMAGSNGFVRTMPFNGAEEVEANQRPVHFAIVYRADGTIVGYRDGKPYGVAYRPGELQKYAAGKSQLVFGLRHGPPGGNRMLAGRIDRALLYDRALTAEEVAASAGASDMNHVSDKDMLARLTETQRTSHQALVDEKNQLNGQRESIVRSESQVLYASISTNPGASRVLRRGDVGSPGDVVTPTGLSAVPGGEAGFGLAPDAPDAERRIRLADWITHRDNPLFVRVMVNRVWHYHFGQGLVTTPSDFGFNGGRPSHPELLDWLASQFQAMGYRLKPLHRLIVTSATYRQASAPAEANSRIDADNRLLWRKAPQRLDAEELRDAVLVVTGRLSPEIGGRGYRDVEHFKFKGSNFYKLLEEATFETHRRTIYRFTPRGGRNLFLDTFDCPDPSTTAPKRANTITPLQALSLMNNSLVFTMADYFAAQVKQEAGDEVKTQVSRVYLRAFGREATPEEIDLSDDFIASHGLAAFCRVILNSNEFLYLR